MKKGELIISALILAALVILVFALILILIKKSENKQTKQIIIEDIQETDPVFNTNQIQINNSVTLNPRTQTQNCTQGIYPDPDCTPGATLNVTAKDICYSGYSDSVRDVSEKTKKEIYKAYDVYNREPYEYEIDHCINLAIGGSNDISNLWPEKYNMDLGARVKDKVENCIHRMVCNGSLDLSRAQYDVCHNWTKYLKENGGTC